MAPSRARSGEASFSAAMSWTAPLEQLPRGRQHCFSPDEVATRAPKKARPAAAAPAPAPAPAEKHRWSQGSRTSLLTRPPAKRAALASRAASGQASRGEAAPAWPALSTQASAAAAPQALRTWEAAAASEVAAGSALTCRCHGLDLAPALQPPWPPPQPQTAAVRRAAAAVRSVSAQPASAAQAAAAAAQPGPAS